VDHSVPGSKEALGETSWQFLQSALVSTDLSECPLIVVFIYLFDCVAYFRCSVHCFTRYVSVKNIRESQH
jgi:hypothetical protein